jgi:hypothetical protein
VHEVCKKGPKRPTVHNHASSQATEISDEFPSRRIQLSVFYAAVMTIALQGFWLILR